MLSDASCLNSEQTEDDRLSLVLASLREIEAKQPRLVRLFTEGDLPKELLEAERTEMSSQRATLGAERSRLEGSRSPALNLKLIERRLPNVIEQIRKWVLTAGTDDLTLILRALDVQMTASSEQVQIKSAVAVLSGTVGDDLATTGQTSA